MSDDSVVVELLFRLKQSSSEPPKPPPSPSTLSLPTGWGHRQPRSKTPISGKKDSVTTTSATRCSPTTPLSWSGGAASPSDGAYDDCSNSSGPSFDPTRSKVCIVFSCSISSSPPSLLSVSSPYPIYAAGRSCRPTVTSSIIDLNYWLFFHYDRLLGFFVSDGSFNCIILISRFRLC